MEPPAVTAPAVESKSPTSVELGSALAPTDYSAIISRRFKMEALGVGLMASSDHSSPCTGGQQTSRDRPAPKESNSMMLPRTSRSQIGLRPRTRTETLKGFPLRPAEVDSQPHASPRPRRAFSDPPLPGSVDQTLTWARENETNTDFLRVMRFSVEPPEGGMGTSVDLMASGSATNRDLVWTTDHSVAYVLETSRDGSVSFSIRKGRLRSIVEQIVLWLVRPPGSSKASIKSVQSQLEHFLCAHERVISTQELLAMLHDIAAGERERLLHDEENLIWQEGVFKFISFWLHSSYYPDFVGFTGVVNSQSMAALHNFITTTFPAADEVSRDLRKELLNMIRDTGPWLQKTNSVTELGTPKMRSKKIGPKKSVPTNLLEMSILSMTEMEAAEALTRVDATMMRSMQRSEMVGRNFESLKEDHPSSHYNLYAERLRKFGFWIATQILRAPKPKTRVRMFRKWVLIAKNCVLLNNFSSTCAILAGLSHQSVTRLTLLMREVPADVMNLKKEMDENFMGFSDNHVRGLIQHCIKNNIPCIPTIDVLRKDMMRIDEGSKGDEEDGLLKFFKVVSFGKAVHFIEQAYSHPFPFEMERTNLSDREAMLEHFVAQMPNAVKSTILLMKLSFDVQRPSAREVKTSLYRNLVSGPNNK